MDQLFLIRKTIGETSFLWRSLKSRLSFSLSIIGELIPRHLHIFSTNSSFKGVEIPQPEKTDPLEIRFPKASPETMSFMKASH